MRTETRRPWCLRRCLPLTAAAGPGDFGLLLPHQDSEAAAWRMLLRPPAPRLACRLHPVWRLHPRLFSARHPRSMAQMLTTHTRGQRRRLPGCLPVGAPPQPPRRLWPRVLCRQPRRARVHRRRCLRPCLACGRCNPQTSAVGRCTARRRCRLPWRPSCHHTCHPKPKPQLRRVGNSRTCPSPKWCTAIQAPGLLPTSTVVSPRQATPRRGRAVGSRPASRRTPTPTAHQRTNRTSRLPVGLCGEPPTLRRASMVRAITRHLRLPMACPPTRTPT